MSTQPDIDSSVLSDASVADYLRRHPDFFLRHDYLLTDLELPHDAKGAVSLIERQVAVLREQRQELKRKLQQLTQTARDNEHLLERIEQLILGLLEARGSEALLRRLRDGLREDFHADAVELKLFGTDSARERELFTRVIERGEPVCGHIAPPQAQYLFGKAADELASGAVIPLFAAESQQCLGVLGIGSIDPRRFHAEMGTTFLRYLGAVVARLLRPAASG
ncbi:DUF484 family protein [Sulfurivermis fontis]|uniref:DUF484 family protein n=1 Tax=Sulfurivermis fontis TaxID=1972068 RepID=UPI0015586FA9|nr:DUF484 family protein [Sulfurivermis fontis]